MNKEAFDAHYNWVCAMMAWAKDNETELREKHFFLSPETLPELIAALPKNVTDAGAITMEYSGRNCDNKPITVPEHSTTARLMYAPHVMGCVAFNVTFTIYQRWHKRYDQRFLSIYQLDGHIMKCNLEKFYPYHLKPTANDSEISSR